MGVFFLRCARLSVVGIPLQRDELHVARINYNSCDNQRMQCKSFDNSLRFRHVQSGRCQGVKNSNKGYDLDAFDIRSFNIEGTFMRFLQAGVVKCRNGNKRRGKYFI